MLSSREQEVAEEVTDMDLFGKALVRGGQQTCASTTRQRLREQGVTTKRKACPRRTFWKIRVSNARKAAHEM